MVCAIGKEGMNPMTPLERKPAVGFLLSHEQRGTLKKRHTFWFGSEQKDTHSLFRAPCWFPGKRFGVGMDPKMSLQKAQQGE